MHRLVLITVLFFTIMTNSKTIADLNASSEKIDRARNAIAKAESAVYEIPDSSNQFDYILELLTESMTDWDLALKAFDSVQKCQVSIDNTTNEDLKTDYQKLMIVSKQLSDVHANSVIIATSYICLVAKNNIEHLDTIKSSLEEISQVKQLVRDNAEYTKKSIAQKYQ